jgi:hypothetical protein
MAMYDKLRMCDVVLQTITCTGVQFMHYDSSQNGSTVHLTFHYYGLMQESNDTNKIKHNTSVPSQLQKQPQKQSTLIARPCEYQ